MGYYRKSVYYEPTPAYIAEPVIYVDDYYYYYDYDKYDLATDVAIGLGAFAGFAIGSCL